MINIQKSNPPTHTFTYKDSDIREKVKNDFFQMCFICEEISRHYEIEHFYPQNSYEHLTNEWHNLFLSCQKCNKIKPKNANTSSDSEILNNCTDDVENIIQLHLNISTKEIEITIHATDKDLIRKAENTKNLCLERIYNGKNTTSLSHIDLRKEIITELARFESLLSKYEKFPRLRKNFESEIAERLSKRTMKSESSFVSFKRRFIRENANYKQFEPHFN